MNTDTRRKASATYHAKRREAGWKKVTVWLPPEGLEQLAKLKAAHGSNDAAVQALLKSEPVQAAPKSDATKPSVKPKKAASEAPVADDVQLGPVRPKPGAMLKKR